MYNTHRSFPKADKEIESDYVMPPWPMYDSEENRQDMAKFMTSVKVVDKCIKIVLDSLRETGLEEETLIIFTTDHGIAFPKMKSTLYDTGLGVSLILKYPGNPKQGEIVDALISQLDIFPTICDLLDLKQPDWLEGNSMVPLLEDEEEKIRDEVYGEVTFHAAYEPMRCIRTDRYKFIKFFGDHEEVVPANIDDSPSKEFLVAAGHLEEPRDKEMLFDLHLDPVERSNLVGNDRYEDIYKDLKRRLLDWMEKTDDPLLKEGQVDKPEGAVVTSRESISPEVNNED
jgi:arylsulfatase A-like enzyme